MKWQVLFFIMYLFMTGFGQVAITLRAVKLYMEKVVTKQYNFFFPSHKHMKVTHVMHF